MARAEGARGEAFVPLRRWAEAVRAALIARRHEDVLFVIMPEERVTFTDRVRGVSVVTEYLSKRRAKPRVAAWSIEQGWRAEARKGRRRVRRARN